MAEIVGQYMGQDDAQDESPAMQAGSTYTEQVQALAEMHPDWNRTQLAREVGCSTSTVARALNNAHRKGE